ncbi:glycoside hydrolase family 13 protein [Schizophyllum amplum]|uniref:Alpha-amylase n=1 Tax=Schizophyllum amplum TaxID=97359 RepID=A0A550BWE1_9AGAR|nr:glycoside hydrolase family 13 protein [Auriculariopsis ampla]
MPAHKEVIAQMFEWTWESVAHECTNFLGPAGYGYVQVSPAQEHIMGDQWYTDYQPVSYNLLSKRGDRAQFGSMVAVCHAAGVKVIADTIWNHMTAEDSGVGSGGSRFTHYDYPGIYQTQDFHHCGLRPDNDIDNYYSRKDVQTCELVNLADLATETDHVRERLAQYGNDLLSLGVDGLRLDAAKHIASDDIANILGRLVTQPYITQEVIYGAGEAVQPDEYVRNGDVQEFRYTRALKDAFLGNGISQLKDLNSKGMSHRVASANVFVANHDTERGGDSLNYKSPSNTYVNALVFSLAHPYGKPTVLSSYEFSDSDSGAPAAGMGSCSEAGGGGGWLCQHRLPAVMGMIGFRNAVGDADISDWTSPQSQRIAFGRGSHGFVAINNVDDDWESTFTTSLGDGTYCDVIGGLAPAGTCLGATYTVSGGKFKGKVPARGALAIHAGAMA